MDPRKRLALAAAGLALIALVAVVLLQKQPNKPIALSQSPPSAGITCLPVKNPVPLPSWYPRDLPMPPGTFPIEIPPDQSGLQRVVFAASGSIRDFVLFTLRNWKQSGWLLGRGEGEPGEAEDNFTRDKRYGIFRARSIFCDTTKTWVLVVVNDPAKTAVPTPTFSRVNPTSTHTTLQ